MLKFIMGRYYSVITRLSSSLQSASFFAWRPPHLPGLFCTMRGGRGAGWWALSLIIQLTLNRAWAVKQSVMWSVSCGLNRHTAWSRRRCCTCCCCPRAPSRRRAWCRSRPRARGGGRHCCWRSRSSGRRPGRWRWLSPGKAEETCFCCLTAPAVITHICQLRFKLETNPQTTSLSTFFFPDAI